MLFTFNYASHDLVYLYQIAPSASNVPRNTNTAFPISPQNWDTPTRQHPGEFTLHHFHYNDLIPVVQWPEFTQHYSYGLTSV